jgi:hypothetical protein
MSAKNEIEQAKRHVSDAESAVRNIRNYPDLGEHYLTIALNELDRAKRELDDALRHVKQLMRD